MAKEKKISFKYYLNKTLKPLLNEDKEEEKYPIYIRITFNRKQTRVKLMLPGLDSLYWSENTLENFLAKKERGGIDSMGIRILKQEKLLEKIIRAKYDREQSEFSFEGVGEELAFVTGKVMPILHGEASYLFESELKIILQSDKYKMIFNKHTGNSLDAQYQIALSLKPDIKDHFSDNLYLLLRVFASFFLFDTLKKEGSVTVYSWLYQSDREDYINFMNILGESESIRLEIEKKARYSGYMRLAYDLMDGMPLGNKLASIIDNQILTSRS